jgi:hypothetical protein
MDDKMMIQNMIMLEGRIFQRVAASSYSGVVNTENEKWRNLSSTDIKEINFCYAPLNSREF